MMVLQGGCLCGAVRYQVTATPIDAGYCHCRLCQKSAGAPVMVWMTVPLEQFALTQGTPATYASSPQGTRSFCAHCGTQLTFRVVRQPNTIDINTLTLDNPEAIQPEYHIWTASQLTWFQVTDTLPRYADDGVDR